jgi:hypothetical protein
VKRYYCDEDMRESDDGEWVYYEDVERLVWAAKQLAMPMPRPMTKELEAVMDEFNLWPQTKSPSQGGA